MSFIRPEAKHTLLRYGEPALYAGLVVWGGWKGWALIDRGHWLGWLLIAVAALAALALFGAVERALVAWRTRHIGPGVVSIHEGSIAYFGPMGGAVMGLDALVSVTIVTSGEDLVWHLKDEFGQEALIPGGASGADALLDRLGTLPGFDHMAVVGAVRSGQARRVTVWTRGPQPGRLSP